MNPCQTAPNIKLVFMLLIHWEISHVFFFFCRLLLSFYKINFFEILFQEYHQGGNQF